MQTAERPVFSVKTEEFEGPLELLIELVEKRKLLINNISLAEVTDEYMERVRTMQEQSLPHTAQFVALAATLLLIKSKSLLPTLDLTDDEEASIDELEERLRQYQLFREIAGTIQQQFGKQVLYDPEYQPKREPLFVPDDLCTIEALNEGLERVLSSLPKDEAAKPRVRVTPTITLEAMMDRLQKRVEQQFSVNFFSIRDEAEEHKTVIVGFLAILELFKQGNVLVAQASRFSDINVELEKRDTPQYF